MKNLWSVVLVAMLAVAHADADAARLGGGKSMGKQSSNVTQREAATPPAAPGAPAQNAAQSSPAKPAAAAAQPAAPAKKPWGAMLGGLAAGLGLAWLASSLGLGEAFGNILMAVLLGVAVLAVVGFFLRRKAAGANGPACRWRTLCLPGCRRWRACQCPSGAAIQPGKSRQRCFGAPLGEPGCGF